MTYLAAKGNPSGFIEGLQKPVVLDEVQRVIEIKSNEKVSSDDFKGLKYLQEKMKERFIAGIVLNTGTQSVPFANNLYALPINVLWNGIWKQKS